jgi:hypothetical protein
MYYKGGDISPYFKRNISKSKKKKSGSSIQIEDPKYGKGKIRIFGFSQGQPSIRKQPF